MELTAEQIADGWIKHDGGKRPVPARSLPTVLFRDGTISPGFFYASAMEWRAPDGIIAYRKGPTS